jgi:hypothetical protein
MKTSLFKKLTLLFFIQSQIFAFSFFESNYSIENIKSSDCTNNLINFDNAIKYCEELSKKDNLEWKLPKLRETKALNKKHGIDSCIDWTWTITNLPEDNLHNQVWKNNDSKNTKITEDELHYAKCVRN